MNNERQPARVAPAALGALRRPPASQHGVTMVEVLATMAISAVILGMAAPSLTDAMRTNRARTASQQLIGLLNDARSEAVKRNIPVLVCPSNDGATCLSTPTAASWIGLTIACYDADANGSCDTSTLTAPNPIRVRSQVDPMVQLSGPAAVVRFNGLGATASTASFSLSTGAQASQSSTITVATTGAVRTY
jgi:type IV fimbrial biogenesis protein FimT